MAVTLRALPSGTDTKDPSELIRVLKAIFDDLEDQLNDRAQIYATSGGIPNKLNKLDTVITATPSKIGLSVFLGKSFVTLVADMIGGLTKHNTNFVGQITRTFAPSLSDFPNANDWGFYEHTGVNFSIVFNFNNTIVKAILS